MNQVKGEKRLASVEADNAFPAKERTKKIDGSGQAGKIQALSPLPLITVRTVEIALVCQNNGYALKLHLFEGARPERMITEYRLSPNPFLGLMNPRPDDRLTFPS